MSWEDVKSISEVSFMAKPPEKEHGKGFIAGKGLSQGAREERYLCFLENYLKNELGGV